MDALKSSGWGSSIPVPTLYDTRGTVRTLDGTLLCNPGLFQSLAFSTGVVLLFSRERGRRRGRFDWTRRWGVLCCYVSLLLCATQFLYIAALVTAGIAAAFHDLPLAYQPGLTRPLADWSAAYVRYGPQPGDAAGAVLVVSSSLAILLACVPLFDALRSSGPKRPAAVLLAPLALFSLTYLAQVGRFCVVFSHVVSSSWYVASRDVFQYGVFFRPEFLVGPIAAFPVGTTLQTSAFAFGATPSGSPGAALVVEAVKWSAVLVVAMWLSIAQLVAWLRRR